MKYVHVTHKMHNPITHQIVMPAHSVALHVL